MRAWLALLLLGSLVAGCVAPTRDRARINEAERSGTCPVHGVRMTKTSVRITYGLMAGPTPRAAAAQKALFPFAHREVLGGCVVLTHVDEDGSRIAEGSSPEIAELYVCGRCDEAKERWIRDHPDDVTARQWRQVQNLPR